ncbi:MAG TPA: type II toxin-antitoxin system VapC family toxin [Stellaceae bacterium]|nr:type II toxin-antitoxin system VapC family toxin [Stellaceae bacterium]
MLAVDTKIVVRYITADDPDQSARARELIDGADIFVASTVLLETEWVLRSSYGFPAPRIADRLRAFAGLPQVVLEAPDAIATALDGMSAGMDFADALHLAAAQPCEGFVTFDRRLGRVARRLGAPSVRVI